MNAQRKLTAAAVLACALAMSVSAGEIYTGFDDPTPPPAPSTTTEETPEDTGETGDALTDLIASLLNGVLSVL